MSQKLKRSLELKLDSVLKVIQMKNIKSKWNGSLVKAKKSQFKHISFLQYMQAMKVNLAFWDTNLSTQTKEETTLHTEDKDLAQQQELLQETMNI